MLLFVPQMAITMKIKISHPMKKKIFNTLFFAAFSLFAICQRQSDDKEKFKIKTSTIYGSLGITPLYGHVSTNFELMFVERPDKVFIKRGVRVGTGIYQYFDDASLNSIISYTCLTGAEKNHFELGVGVAYMHFLTRSANYLLPAPNIGYRYQKPEGNFIFRSGLGFPELLYVGLGYLF